MAREIIWSYEATSDLEALAGYITRDSAYYATSLNKGLRERMEKLQGHSLM